MKGDVSPALPQARRHLESSDFGHRLHVIPFLAKKGTSEDRRRVLGMLQDEHSMVALAAAVAVGETKDPLLLDAATIVLQQRISRAVSRSGGMTLIGVTR